MTPFFLLDVVPIVLVVSFCAIGLAAARNKVRGTTLVAAWWWAVASLTAVSLCEAVIRWQDGVDPSAGWNSRLRFAAAVTTFAPAMAVLGAKRPQHFAWQFIVLTLLVVLALPSFEAALFATGNGPLELHSARRWFLAILIAVGLVNYLPTRSWPAACAYAAAQICLLSDHLPLIAWPTAASRPLAGLGLMAIALWLIALGWPRRAREAGIDRMWLDFRDAYGLAWSLRVQERYNATAAKNGWPIRLAWRGMVSTDAARSPDPSATQDQMDETVARGLTSLLHRFVSRDWIAGRLVGSACRN